MVEASVVLGRVAGEAGLRGRRGKQVGGHPCAAQPGQAFARGARVGILDARHHARHPGMRQQVAAGGAALRTVGTGFERDIGGRPSRSVASLRQSCGLGMRTSASCGPAASDDDFVADQNAGDTGVRVAGRTRARA